ncbi:unnamed protein product [Bemisia tabaci]|uniref:Uncharacterized protein n=1 Tax=Bemisia tabaci TaxID=7038 RepID=A0A9P0AK34_BEMTA|nr:unnamed protein product [Bemisia tabaci]
MADCKPLFLTHKVNLRPLSGLLEVFDFQLRDHALNTDNLRSLQCKCHHFHKKKPCYLTNEELCPRCSKPTKFLVNHSALLFHPNTAKSGFITRCPHHFHTHAPPCHRCIGCRVKGQCTVQSSFQCNISTSNVCEGFNELNDASTSSGSKGAHNSHFTERIDDTRWAAYHVYSTQELKFYVCPRHAHKHISSRPTSFEEQTPTPDVPCYLQSVLCCEEASSITEFQSGFILSVLATHSKVKYLRAASNKSMCKIVHRNELHSSNNSSDLSCAKRSNRFRAGDNFTPAGLAVKQEGEKPHLKKMTGKIGILPNYDSYVIVDPSLWLEQSKSYFISLIKAVILSPALVADRFSKFENASFRVSNIKAYRSGKSSMIRTNVTGFVTEGIYQTAIISCTLPHDAILVPQKIYDLLMGDFDIVLLPTKRDPAINTTCMFVLIALRNPDPSIETLVVPSAIVKSMGQDQDGDKDGCYALRIRSKNGFDRRDSFVHRLARLEMALAMRTNKTLIGSPRLSFSESDLLLMHRKQEELRRSDSFFRKTHSKGIRYMIEAGCGYRRQEYETFTEKLLLINSRQERHCLTIDDVLGHKAALTEVVDSGAKGHREMIPILTDSIKSNNTMHDKCLEMREQLNRYITSGQELRQSGRGQFNCIYASEDLTMVNGCLFLNKDFAFDLKPFTCSYTLRYSEASLKEFLEDLKTAGETAL